MTTVLIADDQAMFASALGSLLDDETDIDIIGICKDGRQTLNLIMEKEPDVALVNIEMPELSGLDVLNAARAAGLSTKIAILTTFRSPGYVRQALENGAAAFITKDQDAEDVAQTIRSISAGEVVVDPDLLLSGATLPANPLKQRHREVLRLTLRGLQVNQIAKELSLSRGTVKNYLSEAIQLLYCKSRVEAAQLARTNGWL